MRTANLKLQQETLFIPGWLVAIIGGHILVLLLLFFITVDGATASAPHVNRTDIPVVATAPPASVPSTRTPVFLTRSGGWAVDGLAVMGVDLQSHLERTLDDKRSVVLIRAHAHAPGSILRRGIEAALAAGAVRVEIQVRTATNGLGAVALDIHAPLPDMPHDARVQQVVDALVARQR